MSAKKFKFVSPGVFLNEIDNSILPREPREIGPMIIGRAFRGPANRPVTVDSFEEFVNIYGNPVAGGNGDDVWRNGNKITPMYGTYAAQAWLKNSPTLTYFRLGGTAHLNNTGDVQALAGWKTDQLMDAAEASTDWSVEGSPLLNASVGSPSEMKGGAFGLWVFDSKITGSGGENKALKQTTGSLAAVWYVNKGSVGLKGHSTFSSAYPKEFAQAEPIASDSSGAFTAVISGTNVLEEITFNFDESSGRFIRKVFNTNPTLVNTSSYLTPSNSQKNYWLGESYENTFVNHVATTCTASLANTNGNKYWGVILHLATDTEARSTQTQVHHARQKRSFTDPRTGWFISQDLSSLTGSYNPRSMQKLFKIISLGHGSWAQKNIKISIQNIKAPTNNFVKYPTFDVVVRNIADNDKAQQVIEKFSGCNLDPNSADFIGAKIGTRFFEFDTTKRRLIEKGSFANRSKYIRVELDPTVEGGTANESFAPFGVYGPVKYRDIFVSGSRAAGNPATGFHGVQQLKQHYTSSADNPVKESGVHAFALGGDVGATRIGLESFGGTNFITSSHVDLCYKLVFPEARLRQNSDQDGLSSLSQVNFGVWTGKSDSSVVFNRDVIDLVRTPSSDISEIHDPSSTAPLLTHQWVFTLDDIKYQDDNKRYGYVSGSRRAGTSYTALSGGYTSLLDTGISAFTTLLYGGTDGFDITEKNPIRNTFHDGTTETSNYAYNTIKQAIDSVKDPEFAEYNIVSIPGITNNSLTRHLIDVTEDRADALAVIDLEGDFQPGHEGANANAGTVNYGSVSTTITNMKNRQINSSYACAYYPYVQVRDTLTGDLVYMPPSVLAIGAMSYTDRVKAPWFAPAGFNRGGLSSGIAGLPVVGVTDRLTSDDRDDLYDANINPIASFPSEGIVIFGQKTLQLKRSALDRINVRRLLLFVKKGISRISNELLFEPNVQETWDRFISRANPFLADVKARFGLTDYKLVLDKTTTTPDLIDQNILYAKVFLKPARAIEFVAVDFIITNTGAAFED